MNFWGVYFTLSIETSPMPGFRKNKGDGFIRSQELLEELRADVEAAYANLEKDKSSQYHRRCVVRSVFSYIEALIEYVKVELRSTVRCEACKATLTEKDLETLGLLKVIGEIELGKFLSLEINLKRTFKLAVKVWGLGKLRLSTDGKTYSEFLAAKSARNRLTHPRTFYDIEVTDYDMHCHTVSGMWVEAECQRLFAARIKELAREPPELA
jgi:hypothetical protein